MVEGKGVSTSGFVPLCTSIGNNIQVLQQNRRAKGFLLTLRLGPLIVSGVKIDQSP